jgi:hypothetical protein
LNLFVDDSSEATDSDCDMPDGLDRVDIGSNHNAAQQTNGLVADVDLFERVLREPNAV